MSWLNRVQLDGIIVEKVPLATTPAGIPLLRFKFQHQSQQYEAGYARKVHLVANVVAAGGIAQAIDRLALDRTLQLEGFLAIKSLKYPTLIFHATAWRPVEAPSCLD